MHNRRANKEFISKWPQSGTSTQTAATQNASTSCKAQDITKKVQSGKRN